MCIQELSTTVKYVQAIDRICMFMSSVSLPSGMRCGCWLEGAEGQLYAAGLPVVMGDAMAPKRRLERGLIWATLSHKRPAVKTVFR